MNADGQIPVEARLTGSFVFAYELFGTRIATPPFDSLARPLLDPVRLVLPAADMLCLPMTLLPLK